jgi:hypothetical protein
MISMSKPALAAAILMCVAFASCAHGAEPAKLAETELGKLAASMEPGAWAKLKTEDYTADLLRVQSHHILEYTDQAVWDPNSREVLFVGQGHYSAVKFIAYSAADNRWKQLPVPSWWGGDPTTGKGAIGHAYDNNAIDGAKGILYFHQSATTKVHRYDIAKGEWSTLPELKGAPTGHGTALVYFPEMKGLVRVLAGSVHFFSEEKNAWSLLKEKVAMGPYHNIAKYSPAEKAVIFGAGNDSKALYRLDAKGEIKALPAAPILVRISSTVVTVDPVTGDVLVLDMESKRKFHAFDVHKNAWRQLPDAPIASGAAAALPELGVNFYFTARPETVYLYKHAARK